MRRIMLGVDRTIKGSKCGGDNSWDTRSVNWWVSPGRNESFMSKSLYEQVS